MPSASRLLLTVLATVFATSAAAQTHPVYRWVDKGGKVSYSDLPPPVDAKDPQQQKLGSANLVDTSGPSYSAQKAARDAPVTLYTSIDCAAECQLARDFLKQRGISYQEKPLKSLDDSRAFKKSTGSDELLVPTLLVGSVASKGFEAGNWNGLLESAGYPSAGRLDPAPR